METSSIDVEGSEMEKIICYAIQKDIGIGGFWTIENESPAILQFELDLNSISAHICEIFDILLASLENS